MTVVLKSKNPANSQILHNTALISTKLHFDQDLKMW